MERYQDFSLRSVARTRSRDTDPQRSTDGGRACNFYAESVLGYMLDVRGRVIVIELSLLSVAVITYCKIAVLEID